MAIIDLGLVVGTQGPQGEDGRAIELSKSSTHIQWRYIGDTEWKNLVMLSDLQGPQGVPGVAGNDGAKGERGDPGPTGKSAFQTAVENGYPGTEAEFNTQLANIGVAITHAEDKTKHTYQYTSTGTSTALTIPLAESELSDGLSILVKLHTNIADAATLKLTNGTARNIVTSDGKNITSGAISGAFLPLTYNATLDKWILTGGGGSGSGASVGVPYERTYTAVGGESNVSILGGDIASYTAGADALYVYKDNIPIFKGDSWTLGANGTSVDFIDRTLTQGQQIHFTVVRWVNTEDVITALTLLEAHKTEANAHSTLFNTKANQAAVDTALAKKANLSEVYSKTETDNLLKLKATLVSPTLTGTPTAPTATAGTNTTQIATTAFVQTAITNAIENAIGGSY